MKQFIRDYFTFDRRQRRGIFVLLSIVFVLIVYLNVSFYLFPSEKIDFTAFEKQIQLLNDSLKKGSDSLENENRNRKTYTNYPKYREPATKKGERFNFNPNNLSEKDWRRLGLTDKQIKVIKNYESKGGKFRSKADIKKMYCIREDLYLSLEPFILIPEQKKDSFYSKFEKKPLVESTPSPTTSQKTQTSLVELNSADSLTLITIRGIKGFYSHAIIKYRNELGGYVTKEQLMELWKFDQEKYDNIETYVSVDASAVKKININTCTDKELKHPYLTWNMVNAIISYRKQHGNYQTVEEIKKTDLVDAQTYLKIAPYLKTK